MKPPKKPRLIEMHVSVEASRLERLRALSEATGVPMAEYVRRALDRVLTLAETQMDTLEKAIKDPRPFATLEKP